MTGKKNAWEGIALLPFIDEQRLLAACSAIDASSLSLAERERNHLGHAHDLVYLAPNEVGYFGNVANGAISDTR